MPSKLSVYNAALTQHLGERKLSSLNENVVMRRRLDSVWDDDFVADCLSEGLWNFAMNTISLTYSPSVETDFGYRYAFDKPDDWVRTALISREPYFNSGMVDYEDEGDYWYADVDTIYVKYVSSSVSWGADLAKWTPKFTRFVESRLAWKASKATTGSDSDAADLEKLQRRLLIQAKAGDAMDEAPRFAPRVTWASARISRDREQG